MIVATAPDRRVALWYLGGIAAAFVVFRLAGWLIAAAARSAPRPSRPVWRLAIGNLHRPGAPTAGSYCRSGWASASWSRWRWSRAIWRSRSIPGWPSARPADFFIDIQPDQLAGFAEIVRGVRAPASSRCRCCAAG